MRQGKKMLYFLCNYKPIICGERASSTSLLDTITTLHMCVHLLLRMRLRQRQDQPRCDVINMLAEFMVSSSQCARAYGSGKISSAAA
jgi:hypothetical protein